MTNTQSCKLVVHGAAGRMGQRIVACALAEPEQWDLVAAIDRTGHPRLGEDAGQVAGVGQVGVPLSTSWEVSADVVVDFSPLFSAHSKALAYPATSHSSSESTG